MRPPGEDLYRGIAAQYDAQQMDWYAATFGGRLFALLEGRGVPAGRLLDAGCGTGTLAIAAAARGWGTTGIDRSPSLLDRARAKDADGHVRWVEGDVERFDLGSRFDLVTCVGDVLNHLESIEGWERAFGRFAAHLEPGGLLFFDAMTARGLERMDTYTVHDRPDGALLLGIVWEPERRRSTLKVTTFVPEGDGLFRRHASAIPEWAQPVEAIERRLRQAGFDEVERPFAEASEPEAEERIAFLARRR